MNGFKKAQQEYERKLTSPFDEEEYEETMKEKEDYMETQADYAVDEYLIDREQ